eukprot:scaffold1280_cov379-Prasinococcus_capsulatus_cf.AAC.13
MSMFPAGRPSPVLGTGPTGYGGSVAFCERYGHDERRCIWHSQAALCSCTSRWQAVPDFFLPT